MTTRSESSRRTCSAASSPSTESAVRAVTLARRNVDLQHMERSLTDLAYLLTLTGSFVAFSPRPAHSGWRPGPLQILEARVILVGADALAAGATAAFVDGRGSRLGVGRMPLAGAGAQAASGSRSWCRRRRCRARCWRPPYRWWPGRRRAAPRTAAAAPRSAGPGPGRAKSPPEQLIEQVFGTESRMLPTATGWTAGGTLGPRPRPERFTPPARSCS
jgi:hypothetical protein